VATVVVVLATVGGVVVAGGGVVTGGRAGIEVVGSGLAAATARSPLWVADTVLVLPVPRA
jgi:hypothetical protein